MKRLLLIGLFLLPLGAADRTEFSLCAPETAEAQYGGLLKTGTLGILIPMLDKEEQGLLKTIFTAGYVKGCLNGVTRKVNSYPRDEK